VDLNGLHQQTRRFAASFGVTGFEPPNRLQSSRRALALAEVARAQGRLEPFRQAAFDAHWRRAEDLEATATLQRLATAAGLDPATALAEADLPETLAIVDARQQEARRNGVTGIPTFVINAIRVVGCQPYEALAAAAERAKVPRR
jgi:predicted DsbA family dithiol-disulfide isomerase